MKHSISRKIRSTVDQAEISHFSSHAEGWWDKDGTYSPLHKMIPPRMEFLISSIGSVKGLNILDIGCGGGLTCEPLARLGANITGLDADPRAIAVARHHADDMGLSITYHHGSAEELGKEKKRFDVVLALEIIEHVSDARAFVEACSNLVKPNGLIIFSTLNRTWKSYALGIVAAERVLNWAPVGTHSWNKFVKPSELAHYCEQSDMTPEKISGLVYRPLHGNFALHPHDLDINYFMVARKSQDR